MTYYYGLFTVFAFVITVSVIDANVPYYLLLLSKKLKIDLGRFYWMIRFHPLVFSSPIGKWMMMRKYLRTVKELSQEASKRDDSAV